MLPPPTFSTTRNSRYGVATIRRLLQIIRLFCRIQSRSFADYSLFYRALLQKRLIISRSLLIVATPYLGISQKLDLRSLDIVQLYCHFTFLKRVRRGIPQLCTYMCLYVHIHIPPKNGEIALWLNMRVVKCKCCVSQKTK